MSLMSLRNSREDLLRQLEELDDTIDAVETPEGEEGLDYTASFVEDGDNEIPAPSRNLRSSSGRPPRPQSAMSRVKSLRNEVQMSRQPKWLKNDREVLRFFLFFRGSMVPGVGREEFRIRKCILLWYLEDDTCSIDEPRTTNSGLTQGAFMTRRAMKKNPGASFANVGADGGGGRGSGTSYSPVDFLVGNDVEVYGRILSVVDADQKTRAFVKEKYGIEMIDSLPYPDDGYDDYRRRRKGPSQEQDSVKTEKGRFFKREQQKVLRFFCSHEDDRLYGERIEYTLHYFLNDDTCEIKESFKDGRHHFPNLLRRQRLPKDSHFVPSGSESPRTLSRHGFVHWSDLKVGETLVVYGKRLLVTSCDGNTQRFYAKHHVEQRALRIWDDSSDQAPPEVPPFNGFGSEDDLYAMGLSLEPAMNDDKQGDYRRFMQSDKKVLRFQAKLVGESVTREDANRDFIVNYFLSDESVSVYEPPIRNSGIVGGKFLERGKYKKYLAAHGEEGSFANPVGGGRGGHGGAMSRVLRATDFYVGNTVVFEMPSTGSKLFTLKIVGCDTYTQKLLRGEKSEWELSAFAASAEAEPENTEALFRMSDADLILTRMAETLVGAKVPLRAILQDADIYMVGSISPDAFRNKLDEVFSLAGRSAADGATDIVRSGEIDTLVAHFSAKTRGEVDLDEEKAVNYHDFVDHLVLLMPTTAREQERARQGAPVNTESKVLKLLRHAFIGHKEGSGLISLRAEFRKFDTEATGRVRPALLAHILRKFGLKLTAKERSQLKMKYDTDNNDELDYTELCNAIYPGDFNAYIEESLHLAKSASRASVSSVSVFGGGGSSRAPDTSTAHRGKNPTQTIGEYLWTANKNVRNSGGDEVQLLNAMRSFSSSFARHNRKKMMRKHFMAFDVDHSGTITRDQFVHTVDDVTAEFFIDFDPRDRGYLSDYFFPAQRDGSDTLVDYQDLLDTLFKRDLRKAAEMHNMATSGVATGLTEEEEYIDSLAY